VGENAELNGDSSEITFLMRFLPRGKGAAERSGTGLLGVCFNESEDDRENMLAVSATVGPFLHFKPCFTATRRS
jgi:hypothetical protein